MRCSRNSLVGPGKSSSLSVAARSDSRPLRSSSVSSARPGRLGAALQGLGPQRLGPAAGRVAELPAQEADDRVGDVELRGVGLEVRGVDPGADEVQREVADDLGRRRHLDEVPEHPVGGGVGVLDLLEPVPQPERDGLLAQVGELPAGDLVVVDAAGRRGEPGLERRVDLAHDLPVGLERVDGVEGQAGLALGVVGRGDQGRERRLRGRPGHRRDGAVDGVDPGVDRRGERRELAARGVVGVQVHGQVEALAQRGDELARGRGTEQPGHVLDGQDVRAGLDDLLGQTEVVVQRVELLAGVHEVAGVAEGDLGDGPAGLAHRVDRRPHLADVVERVEDPEDVDAGAGGLGDERVGDLGRVGRVADGVAPAQQHLQADVRDRLAQPAQALPRVLGEEAQRDVVGRAAPALQRQQLRGGARDVRGDLEQVAGAHAGGEQRLVGVAEGRVGDPDGGLLRAARRRSPPGRARPGAAWTRRAAPRPGPPPAASRAGRRGAACRRWAC